MHGGGPRVSPGKPLPEPYLREDLGLLEAGLCNLVRHIEIARSFGVPVVVAVNRFPQDSARELERLRRAAAGAGSAAVVAEHWARGGEGALDLADAVTEAAATRGAFRFLYPLEMPLREKVETIAREIYGARGVSYSDVALRDIERCERLGFAQLPVCMAKTHLSLSHDPELKGVPTGFTLPVREVRVSAGAGFVYPLCGDMQAMPGLPVRPVFMDIDLDAAGEIAGIS
jgi:formyltetrahydrofolate synthetase